MIGLDTNILLRLFLQDDPEQGRKVGDLFSRLDEIGPGYVNCITLMEFAWFLRKRIRLSREQVMEAIADLLDAEDIVMEDERLIEEVLGIMATSPAEFADIFIAMRNRSAGCSSTVTFDARAAAHVPGMETLA